MHRGAAGVARYAFIPSTCPAAATPPATDSRLLWVMPQRWQALQNVTCATSSSTASVAAVRSAAGTRHPLCLRSNGAGNSSTCARVRGQGRGLCSCTRVVLGLCTWEQAPTLAPT